MPEKPISLYLVISESNIATGVSGYFRVHGAQLGIAIRGAASSIATFWEDANNGRTRSVDVFLVSTHPSP